MARRAGRRSPPPWGRPPGVGFAIKPHYLLLPATLECLLWWRLRRPLAALRPETLGALRRAHVIRRSGRPVHARIPHARRPYALEVYDSAYRNSWSFVLARPETLLVPAAVLLHLRARRSLAAPQAAIGDVLTAGDAGAVRAVPEPDEGLELPHLSDYRDAGRSWPATWPSPPLRVDRGGSSGSRSRACS